MADMHISASKKTKLTFFIRKIFNDNDNVNDNLLFF